jgi:protoporphyrinogen oxidase
MKRVVIVGAGYTGLSAAHVLATAGHKVTILEASDDIGGLAGTFELMPGKRLEKFYHHWFSSDSSILDFLRALGLGDKIRFSNTNTGLYFANSTFRLTSPMDLLRFHPLPLIDRIRTGVMALVARRVSDWKPLESISAADWILKLAGRKSYEVIWKPLLQGKFGIEADNISAVWFWNKMKLRGSSRDKKGAEQLAYFTGSFGAATEAIRVALEKLGVEIKLSTPVHEICSENGRVTGVKASSGFVEADAVLATLPLPLFLGITPALPERFVAQASKIRYLGNVCLILRLKHSLSETYWLNVADPEYPFVGVIEHTNFDDPANYGGERIAYISKYLPTSDKLYKFSEHEFFEYALPYVQKIFPNLKRDSIIGYKVWKAEYSQPIIVKNYSELIPDVKAPIEGLWLSNMAQIYPEDRGTNYAVRHGKMVAGRMLQEFN